MSFEELIGDDGDRSLPKGYPKAGTYKIIVDIAHQVTMVYKADEGGEYRPERYMLCSTGINGRTPKGTFKMGAYRVRFSKFARDGRYGQLLDADTQGDLLSHHAVHRKGRERIRGGLLQ